MAARTCATVLTGCPGVDTPITNASAESPDPLLFAAVAYPIYRKYKPPCIGCVGPDPEIDCQWIMNLIDSYSLGNPVFWADTQLMANLMALAAQLGCDWPPDDNPLPPPVPPPFPPPIPEPTAIYSNDEQRATVYCPNGTAFTYTVPAGTKQSPPIIASLGAQYVQWANAWALAYAQLQASLLLTCITPDDNGPPDIIIPGDGTANPPGQTPPPNIPSGPGILVYPGWMCFGNEYFQRYRIPGTFNSSYTIDISAGTLPPGLTFQQIGPREATISGFPTAPGEYTWTIRAVGTFMPQFTITAQDSLWVFGITNADTLPDGFEGFAYADEQLNATGGTAPYSFASSNLPSGFSLTAAGILSSNDTIVAGDYTFDVTITDAHAGECTETVSITVLPQACADWTTVTWVPYTASAGTGVSSCTESNNTFELSVSCIGPGAEGASAATYDGISTSRLLDYSGPPCDCVLRISLSNLNGVFNSSLRVYCLGLPDLLSVVSLSGYAEGSYDFPFTLPDCSVTHRTVFIECPIQVTEVGHTGLQSATLYGELSCDPLSFTPKPIPYAELNIAYDEQLVGTGGTAPYTFAITAGTLPTGLSMDGTGHITGTPTVAETKTITIEITDDNAVTTSQDVVCISIASNIQDVVWTPTHGTTACHYGVLASGICSDWLIREDTGACSGAGKILHWSGRIYNPGLAYNIQLDVRYASSGATTGGTVFLATLTIGATSASHAGSVVTDTPNPLTAVVSIGAGAVANISVDLHMFMDPGPPANFIQIEDAVVGGTNNLTLTPLTHP